MKTKACPKMVLLAKFSKEDKPSEGDDISQGLRKL
jgi:hypothetical protein